MAKERQSKVKEVVERLQTAEPVQGGTVIVVGEEHESQVHQAFQVALIKELQLSDFRVSVAMEFFPFTAQSEVDEWLNGKLKDEGLTQAIGFAKNSKVLSFYKPQLKAVDRGRGARVMAINAPKILTKKVSKSGMDNLLPFEKAWVPPGFAFSDDLYRERFQKSLEDFKHRPYEFSPPKASLKNVPMGSQSTNFDNYFAAQSLWDDTMAFHTIRHLRDLGGIKDVIVLIVGDFHSSFNGGLVQRLKLRAPETRIWNVSAVRPLVEENKDPTFSESLGAQEEPHPIYGSRADFIWIDRTLKTSLDPMPNGR